jgi:hypothetical protein
LTCHGDVLVVLLGFMVKEMVFLPSWFHSQDLSILDWLDGHGVNRAS